MLGAFAVLLVGSIVKRLATRRRPFSANQGVTAAIWAPGPLRSFPSTHAATACALATSLAFLEHPLAPLVTPLAVGVCWSRVWLGVHHATDVLAGAALGIGFGALPWVSIAQSLVTETGAWWAAP